MRQQLLRSCLAAAAAVLAMALAPGAQAIDLQAGDWKFTITGNVNGDYIYADCDSRAHAVIGGLACTAPTGSSSVSNGLLPAAIAFNGSTTQAGFDIGFTFGFYPGISTNDGGSPNQVGGNTGAHPNVALGTTGLDIRQVFLTFGNDTMGTVLVGRNIGLFGADVILNDMTLIGVGAGGPFAAPANTSLGSIGLGYIYTDWLAQIDYTTPSFGGAKVTVGVFDPLESVPDPATTRTAPGGAPLPIPQPGSVTKNLPGAHAKVSWTGGPLYLSGSFLFQKQRGIDAIGDTDAAGNPLGGGLNSGGELGFGYTSWAFDAGGKFDMGPVEILGWYYRGTGVGTTGLFYQANDPFTGRPRDSDGFLAQITFQAGPTKLGFNYGQSRLYLADGEFNGALVAKNDKYTVGIYHNLTDNLTLLAEATYVQAFNQAGQQNHANVFNVGAYIKF